MLKIEQKVTISDHKKSNYYYEEAMKTFRTNLALTGRSNKIIMVTSTYPNEGKSEMTFQLCRQIGGTGKRTVLVDADIRKSTYLSKAKMSDKVFGLSEFLSGQAPLNKILFRTNNENMDIIFAGKPAPNPSELFEDPAFEEMLKLLANEYDYVVVDTAPIGMVIDAAIIGKYCDGAVYVIEQGATSYKAAQKAKEQLERSGCKILGAVLNKVDMHGGNKYYGGKYGKYGKYKKYAKYGEY